MVDGFGQTPSMPKSWEKNSKLSITDNIREVDGNTVAESFKNLDAVMNVDAMESNRGQATSILKNSTVRLAVNRTGILDPGSEMIPGSWIQFAGVGCLLRGKYDKDDTDATLMYEFTLPDDFRIKVGGSEVFNYSLRTNKALKSKIKRLPESTDVFECVLNGQPITTPINKKSAQESGGITNPKGQEDTLGKAFGDLRQIFNWVLNNMNRKSGAPLYILYTQDGWCFVIAHNLAKALGKEKEWPLILDAASNKGLRISGFEVKGGKTIPLKVRPNQTSAGQAITSAPKESKTLSAENDAQSKSKTSNEGGRQEPVQPESVITRAAKRLKTAKPLTSPSPTEESGSAQSSGSMGSGSTSKSSPMNTSAATSSGVTGSGASSGTSVSMGTSVEGSLNFNPRRRR